MSNSSLSILESEEVAPIKVYARVRPKASSTRAPQHPLIYWTPDSLECKRNTEYYNSGVQSFTFEKVLGDTASQREVFKTTAKPLCKKFV